VIIEYEEKSGPNIVRVIKGAYNKDRLGSLGDKNPYIEVADQDVNHKRVNPVIRSLR